MKDKNTINPDTHDNSSLQQITDHFDPTPATTHTGSHMLDVPFTPQQKFFLMSILGLGGQ